MEKKRKEYLKNKKEEDIKALEAKIEKIDIVDYLNYSKALYKQKKKKRRRRRINNR